MHIQRQNEAFAYRLAMPAPAPEGLTFHYWPEDDPRIEKITPAMRHLMKFPAVEAKVNGQHAGFISWDAHPRWDGEISMIQVPKEFQHHSIATSLFDHARTINPKLHHSPIKTEEGEGWARHEERRHTPAGQYRDLKNPKIPIKRKRLNANTIRCAADLTKKFIDQLQNEFTTWHQSQPNPDDWPLYRGVGGWENVEKFLHEKYPACYRGFDYCLEQARPLMHDKGFVDNGKYQQPPHYETGPEAEAKYGYDPKAVAAGMILLHNKENDWHGDRGSRIDVDTRLLNDIFQKRVMMQHEYEQRKLVNANTIRCADSPMMGININDSFP